MNHFLPTFSSDLKILKETNCFDTACTCIYRNTTWDNFAICNSWCIFCNMIQGFNQLAQVYIHAWFF